MVPVDMQQQTPQNDVQLPAMTAQPQPSNDLKRKRSPSHDALHPTPVPKAAKTSNHLQINYLARQCDEDLPLISTDDTLPSILNLLNNYQGVLDRHESMACNLGARPLGPILVKRFERLFDGPPKVLKSHGKDGTTVSWLDVVEFARNKPEQFQLGQMSEGVRVCQFYTKQCRVQISEEDFVLISSGIPQKMIPPQPIMEDEEKELLTLDILEGKLTQLCQQADTVAARCRQINHRIKGRKEAILNRRAATGAPAPIRPASPSNVALMNGANSNIAHLTPTQPSGGFVPVNASRPLIDQTNGNGTSLITRHDLLSKFHSMSDWRPQSQPPNGHPDARRGSIGAQIHAPGSSPSKLLSKPAGTSGGAVPPPVFSDTELSHVLLPAASPVAIPNTPSSLLPNASNTPHRTQPQEKDDGGPFKAEMMRRVESLAKGERILPPCDRCRRLHMDCMKNLTACAGCTKKHAKCSWKEVREEELRPGAMAPLNPHPLNSAVGSEAEEGESGFEKASTGSPAQQPPVAAPMSAIPVMGSDRGTAGPHTPGSSTAAFPFSPGNQMLPSRTSPPDKGIEQQLQETAKSTLAVHASAQNAAKAGEYQTLVA